MAYTSAWSYAEHLTEILLKDQEEVLQIYEDLRLFEGKKSSSLQSMHSTIGGKNNIFVDSIRTEFLNPRDFKAQWIKGLCDQYGEKLYEGPNGKHQYIILEMMKFPVCSHYIDVFLERNFYRNVKERKRFKPNENLWEIWFGSNPLFWGIMISPAFRNGQWTNDVSEIRRAKYEYWTLGHILNTGIVMPENPQPYTFSDIGSFINFYEQIIFRLSKSDYEKEIMQQYFKYLSEIDNVFEVPLLIPELRFENENVNHKYRLDFTILNSYTRELIGFEISPQSTHMQISGIKTKTQKDMNEDIKEKWEKEMAKRNEYFSQYGITTITFTDEMLKNIENCFEIIKRFLEKRIRQKVDFEEQTQRLQSILRKCS